MTAASRLALVALGGAGGGAARALIAELVIHAAAAPAWSAPALLAVNLSGSLFAGFVRGRLERQQAAGKDGAVLDALILVGFCGGFTSYSSFVSAAAGGPLADSVGIAAATLVLCPLAALLGMRLSGGYPARPAGNPR